MIYAVNTLGHIFSALAQHAGGDDSDQKIVAPRGMYLGVFANHYTDSEHLACFEKMAGENADISQRFLNFKKLDFPGTEAKRMEKRGGALYLVLEPGSGKKVFDSTFPPEEISSGKYDKELEEFAEECEDYDGPIFTSFRAPRDIQHDPKLIKAAYIYIHKKLTDEGAKNITWVWHVNLDDPNFSFNYPGKDHVDWVSVTLYQTNGNSPASVIKKLEDNIHQLKKLGKPIMVEFGSNAPPLLKAEFIKMVIAKFKEKELGIKAFIINNVSQVEGSDFKTWSLTTDKEKKALEKAIATHEHFLKEKIITREGELKGEPKQFDKKLNCSKIEQNYYTPAKAKAITWFIKLVKEKEEYFKPLVGPIQKGDPHYNNKQRIGLARAYQALSLLTENEDYLDKAKQVLDEALESPDPVLIYHGEKKFIREYFEILLAMANLHIQTDTALALEYCKKVFVALAELENIKFSNPNQARKESYPGFYHKTLAIQARILENLKNYDKADELYRAIIDWADKEHQKDLPCTFPFVWESTWFRGENVDDVKYDGAWARIRSAFINLKNGNTEKALVLFKYVLNWEKVGDQEGFMDLAFGALIGIMRAYLQDDAKKAKERFDQELPWKKINKYTDLKEALNIEDIDLSSSETDRWQVILSSMSSVLLPSEQLEDELDLIKAAAKGIK